MSELRAPRRDKGQLQITNRDALVLRWIAEQYTISFDHLQLLLGQYAKATTKDPDKLSISATRDTIQRWLQLGLIEQPRKLLAEHPPYIWLSRHGLTQFELPYSYYHPKISTIHHLYAVNAIRLHMQSFNISAEWISQRTIRLQGEHRPLPDAYMEVDTIPLTAIQVTEQQRLANITLQEEITNIQALAQRYTRIWYFSHVHITEILKTAIHEFDTKSSKNERLADSIIWYTLQAKEIHQQQEQEPA